MRRDEWMYCNDLRTGEEFYLPDHLRAANRDEFDLLRSLSKVNQHTAAPGWPTANISPRRFRVYTRTKLARAKIFTDAESTTVAVLISPDGSACVPLLGTAFLNCSIGAQNVLTEAAARYYVNENNEFDAISELYYPPIEFAGMGLIELTPIKFEVIGNRVITLCIQGGLAMNLFIEIYQGGERVSRERLDRPGHYAGVIHNYALGRFNDLTGSLRTEYAARQALAELGL